MDHCEPKATIMDEATMKRAITRIAHEILEHNEGSETIALVGIVRRGATLARSDRGDSSTGGSAGHQLLSR